MAEPKLHDDESLNRLADGDLDASEEARVRAALAQDTDAQRRVRELDRLGVLMRAAGQEWQAQADPEALFARIEAAVAENGEKSTPGVRADNAHAPRVGEGEGRRGSLWHRLFGQRSWIPAAGVLAVTAAVLMTVYRPIDPEGLEPRPGPGERKPTATSANEPQATPDAEDMGGQGARTGGDEAAAPIAPPSGAEVVQVDFGTNAGTVFDVALADGRSTAVIWINDEQ